MDSQEVKSYQKSLLTNDEVNDLYSRIGTRLSTSTPPELASIASSFCAASARLQAAMSKMRGSIITPELVALDSKRDRLAISLRYYGQFAKRQTDQAVANAGTVLVYVMNQVAYKHTHKANYASQTSKINNLMEELKGRYAADLAPLGISQTIDELEQTNNQFIQAFQSRTNSMAGRGEKDAVRRAREEAQQAFDFVRQQLNGLQGAYIMYMANGGANATPGMGTGGGMSSPSMPTDYSLLIETINLEVQQTVLSARRRRKAGSSDSNEAGNTQTPTGSQNEGGDENSGEDNTPSANA